MVTLVLSPLTVRGLPDPKRKSGIMKDYTKFTSMDEHLWMNIHGYTLGVDSWCETTPKKEVEREASIMGKTEGRRGSKGERARYGRGYRFIRAHPAVVLR